MKFKLLLIFVSLFLLLSNISMGVFDWVIQHNESDFDIGNDFTIVDGSWAQSSGDCLKLSGNCLELDTSGAWSFITLDTPTFNTSNQAVLFRLWTFGQFVNDFSYSSAGLYNASANTWVCGGADKHGSSGDTRSTIYTSGGLDSNLHAGAGVGLEWLWIEVKLNRTDNPEWWIYKNDTTTLIVSGNSSEANPTLFGNLGFCGFRIGKYDDMEVLYWLDIVPPVVPDVILNTSILLADFNLSSTQFATSIFFNAYEIEFNTTATVNLTFLSAFNLLKISGGSTNQIFGRILIDNSIIHSESLRTVSTIGDEGSSGFQPINFEVDLGEHNITIQLRRTLGGTIEINDLDLLLIEYMSSKDKPIRTEINSVLYDHSDTSFKQGFNWSIPQKTGNLFIFNKQVVQSTTSSIVDYVFTHLDNKANSTFVKRFLSGSSDVGSLGNIWVHTDSDEINQNYSLLSRTNTGIVTVNTSILDFDLKDSDNNTIQFFSDTNTTTNFTNNLSLSAGSNLLLSNSHLLHDGDSILLSGVITFKSTSGSQTPQFVLNSTNNSLSCFTKKERFLSSNADIGNVYLFTRCDSSMVINSSYRFNFYVNVPTGEILDILDESFSLVETTKLDIASIPPNLSMLINTSLVDNTDSFNNLTLPVNYNFTIGEDNAFSTANCSLVVNTAINQTQVDRNASTQYLFNLSFGFVENTFNISVNCTNPEITASSGLFSYRVDNIDPIIRTDFANLSSFNQLSIGRFQANFTDNNLFAYNISWFNPLGTEFRNTFAENLSVIFVSNLESFPQTDLGVFTYRLQGWDSHNPLDKKVRPIHWYEENNNLFVENMVINGNIKYYDNENKSITYFYLSDNKYKFKVTFNNDAFEHTLFITAKDWQIVDVPYKQYTIWLINRQTNRYFDFDNPNLDYVEIQKNGILYIITIYLLEKSDEIEFESIGDLNFQEQTYTYSVIAQAPQLNFTVNLTGIENAIIGIGNDLREGLNMIWVIIFVAIFFAIGFLARQPLYWNFSGIGLMVIAFNFIQQLQTNDTLFNFAIAIMFFTFGILIMLLSVFLFFRNKTMKKEAIDFYNI